MKKIKNAVSFVETKRETLPKGQEVLLDFFNYNKTYYLTKGDDLFSLYVHEDGKGEYKKISSNKNLDSLIETVTKLENIKCY